MGCNQPSCQRAHTKLQGQLEGLDRCVQMQLLRRGSLRRMKPETHVSATEKIQRLRAEVSKDKSAKVQDGKTQAAKRASGGPHLEGRWRRTAVQGCGERKVSWAVPMKEVDLTQQEGEFQRG